MQKYSLSVLTLVITALLFVLSVQAAKNAAPEKPIDYAVGYALVSLVMPFLFGLLAAVLKKSINQEPFDWILFYWFVIGFALVSAFGKYSEWRRGPQPKASPPQTEQVIDSIPK